MSISAVPSLWFAIANDGRVKYTTDSSRASKWKQSDSYRLVRDYYTAPPKREWVGLEDEDVATVKNEFNRGALWAEQVLKEKNT